MQSEEPLNRRQPLFPAAERATTAKEVDQNAIRRTPSHGLGRLHVYLGGRERPHFNGGCFRVNAHRIGLQGACFRGKRLVLSHTPLKLAAAPSDLGRASSESRTAFAVHFLCFQPLASTLRNLEYASKFSCS